MEARIRAAVEQEGGHVSSRGISTTPAYPGRDDAGSSPIRERVERARLDRLNAWTEELAGRRRARSGSTAARCLGRLVLRPPAHVVAARAITAIAERGDDACRDVLALVDELLAVGGHIGVVAPPPEWSEAAATHPDEPRAGIE